jgi:hypothetical protein
VPYFPARTDAQAAQWLQLSTLLTSKRNIEKQILERVKSIDKMARNISQELIAILDGRLEELGEPTKKVLPQGRFLPECRERLLTVSLQG